jgi:hypothetical protein
MKGENEVIKAYITIDEYNYNLMVVEKGFGLIQGYIMSNQRFYNYF